MTAFDATQIRKPTSESDFELKVGRLFKILLNDRNVKRFGTRGQRQHGIDLIGKRDGRARHHVGVQCKLKGPTKKLSESEVRTEVASALKYWPHLVEYFIVTTAENDTRLVTLAAKLQQAQAKNGRRIVIEVWGWGTLVDEINRYPEAKDIFDPGYSPAVMENRRALQTIIERQATKHQIKALSEKLDSQAATLRTHVPSALADRAIVSEQKRILCRRGFREADWPQEITQLAMRAIDGDLSMGSAKLRAEVIQRAARSNASTKDHKHATALMRALKRVAPSTKDPVLEALLAAARGDTMAGIRQLRKEHSDDSRSATLHLLAKQRGARKALAWLDSQPGGAIALGPVGAMNALVLRTQTTQFDKGLQDVSTLPKSFFEQCPALHLIKAHLLLAAILPSDQKSTIFQGLPLDPKTLALASGKDAEIKRKAARAEIEQLLLLAPNLELPHLRRVLSEFHLWLQLEDESMRATALLTLATEFSDPRTTLQRVRLALAYGAEVDIAALSAVLKEKQAAGSDFREDELFAAFLIAYHAKDYAVLASFFEVNHSNLYGHEEFSRPHLAAMEVETVARAGRLEKARQKLKSYRATYLSPKAVRELRATIDAIENGSEIERLRKRYDASGDLTDLRVLVSCLQETKDANALADYVPLIARSTRQTGDFRSALRSLYRACRYDAVVSLTEELPELLSLDRESRSLKAWALLHCGRVIEARELARELYQNRLHSGSNDRELAINTSLLSGDWGYLQSILTEEARSAATLDAHTLIRLARLAFEVASPYMRKLRDAAVAAAGDNPNILLEAYLLAVEEGAESEQAQAHEWFQRAVELSGDSGPVQTVALKDLAAQSRKWQEQVTDVASMLKQGAVPIAVAAQGLRRQPLDMYVGQATRNAENEDPRRQVPIMAFCGARNDVDLSKAKAIGIDISTIYTLEYLGLLKRVLQSYSKIVIAPSVFSALFTERHALRVRQPIEVGTARRMLRLVSAGKLNVLFDLPLGNSTLKQDVGEALAAMLLDAKRKKSVVVRSAPIHKLRSYLNEESDLSEYSSVLADTLAVLSFLQSEGRLDLETAQQASIYLKQVDKGWKKGPKLSRRSSLYLDELTVTYLDHVSLLEPLLDAVDRVSISRDTEQRWQALVDHAEQTEELLSVIESARTALGTSIEKGRISLAPHRSDINNPKRIADAVSECLSSQLELLHALGSVEAIVVDDRFMNKDPFWIHEGHKAPAATTIDLLRALHSRGDLAEHELWLAHHKLRQAGYCYVPVETAELLHRIANAPSMSGRIRETPELQALRESLSLPVRADVFIASERKWLDQVRLTFFRAIREVWALGAPNAEAQADWLLNVQPLPMCWPEAAMNDQAWTQAIQQYVAQVSLMIVNLGGNGEHRARFLAWSSQRILAPLAQGRQWVIDEVAKFLKVYLVRLLEVANAEA